MKTRKYYRVIGYVTNNQLGVKFEFIRLFSFSGKKGKKRMVKRVRSLIKDNKQFPLYKEDRFSFKIRKGRIRF